MVTYALKTPAQHPVITLVDSGGTVYTPDSNLPWVVTLFAAAGAPITNVNWSTFNYASASSGSLDSSGAQNAEASWDVVLGAGTWTLETVVITSISRGIITASLDGTNIGTMDCYSGSSVVHVHKIITDISIATSGKKRLRFLMATKNASSSGYLGQVETIQFRRTA